MLSDDGGGITASQLLLLLTKGIVRFISSRKYILGFDDPFNMLVMVIRCFCPAVWLKPNRISS